MADIPSKYEDLSVVIELEGMSEAAADELRSIFDDVDEEVVYAQAFGGRTLLQIAASLGQKTFDRLSAYFGSRHTIPSKTVVKIGRTSIELKGFSPADIEALLASKSFQRAFAMVKRK